MLSYGLRALAPLIAQDAVILLVVALLLGWTSWSGVQLWRASVTLRKAFDAAADRVELSEDATSFASAYESDSAALSNDPLLGAYWRGFNISLIVPLRLGSPILSTSASREWFDLAALFRKSGADLRYHAALPGLLVGAGLLFTFLGLAAALSAAGNVVAANVAQAERTAALRDLLGAASVKFITSLAGLLCSIGYSLFRKRQLRLAELALGRFLHSLQDRLPFRTAASLQAEGNALLEKQFAEVQRIGSDFS